MSGGGGGSSGEDAIAIVLLVIFDCRLLSLDLEILLLIELKSYSLTTICTWNAP